MVGTTNRSRMLRLRTEVCGRDEIVVSVEDSGPGIDPRQLEKVFNAFVSTKAHGTGLGLAICRMIAEGHGGRLTASSDGKSGALFQFMLPIGSTDQAEGRLSALSLVGVSLPAHIAGRGAFRAGPSGKGTSRAASLTGRESRRSATAICTSDVHGGSRSSPIPVAQPPGDPPCPAWLWSTD
jgi:hypothetical protein